MVKRKNMVAAEVLAHLYKPDERQKLVAVCFGENGTGPLVNHKGKDSPENFTPLAEVLNAADCPPALISALLTKDGQKWNSSLSHPDVNIWAQNEKNTRSLFKVYATVILVAAQYSLDWATSPHGYNEHTDEHVRHVANRVVWLLQQGNYSHDEVWLGRVVGESHDLFNLLSRKLHQHGASKMVAHLFPQFLNPSYSDHFHRIDRAVNIHTEAVASAVFMAIREEYPHPQEFLKKLNELLGPETLSLIISDKTDISPRRAINTVGVTPEALRADPHFALNLMAQTENFYFTDGRKPGKQKSLTWKMRFSPDLVGEYSSAAYEVMQNMKTELPKYEQWLEDLWHHYLDRITLVAYSVFALYPSIDFFAIVVENAYEEQAPLKIVKEGTQSKRTVWMIRRQTMDEDLARLQRQYLKVA